MSEYLYERVPKKSFSSVGGLKDIKDVLRDEISFYKYYVENNCDYVINGNILFAGPPGTGKTLMAEALATELGWRFFEINSSTLISRYLGDTSQNIEKMYESLLKKAIEANQEGKGIVFFIDEVDFIAKERQSEDIGEAKRIVTTVLKKLEGIKFSDTRILTIAATNHGTLLDRAAWSRFQLILTFHLPEPNEREEILRVIMGEFQKPKLNILPDLETFVKTIAENTKRFSGRNLRSLIEILAKKAIAKGTFKIDQNDALKLIEDEIVSATDVEYHEEGKAPSAKTGGNVIWHSEMNKLQYEELFLEEIRLDSRYQQFLKVAEYFENLPDQIQESLRGVDFFYLQFENPKTYLEKLKQRIERI